MTKARTSSAGSLGPFLLAFGLAALLAALSEHAPPLTPASTIEIGNDFIAFVGLVFAVVQLIAHRRSLPLRSAWSQAALGMLIIVFEDHLELLSPQISQTSAETLVSAVFWLAAGLAILSFGRRHAMRRHVMNVLRTGFALALVAAALHFALHLLASPPRVLGRIEDLAELAATALFVAGLMLSQVVALKDYRFSTDKVGTQARRLFYDFGLEKRMRYPVSHPAFGLPVIRELLIIGVIVRFFPVAAGAVRQSCGVGYRRQLLDLLRIGFAHGVDAKSYYVHELYRREPGLFEATITRVETKNGLNGRIQRARPGADGPSDMNDKLEFWRVCESNGVASARILATAEEGAIAWLAGREAFDKDLFVKDRSGRGGRFTLNFERVGPFLFRDDRDALVNLDEIARRLQEISTSRRLIVQPKLRNHPEIATLTDKSLAVFRVMTCMDEHGEPQVTHGVLRLLRRFEPNWPTSPDADWGCAVDLETGELGLMTGDAPETCTRWSADHPVTGERVAGRRLTGWAAVAELALEAHRVFSARTLVGWDIGLTPDGPVILEGNSNPDFSYFQRVTRTPVGRSPLGPLLNGHLNRIAAKLLLEAENGGGRAPEPGAAAARPDPRLVAARLTFDRFFERGVGGQAAGALADLRYAVWRRSRPGATYAKFYAHRVERRLDGGGAHKTLGRRFYKADPIAGSVAHEPEAHSRRGLHYFQWFEARGLSRDMVCVDFGCGSLRVGQHFIRYLESGRYFGLDVVDRFYREGLDLLGPELAAVKLPRLSVIDAGSLRRAALRNPDLIFSTAVIQHVPPAELDAYFAAVAGMMGPRSAAVVNFKRVEKTARIGSSAWAQSLDDLVGAVRRTDPTLLVAVEDLAQTDGEGFRQTMLILARTPAQLARWTVAPTGDRDD